MAGVKGKGGKKGFGRKATNHIGQIFGRSMADPKDNGNLGKGPVPPDLSPENIAHQVTVAITKDGRPAIIGDLGNLPLMLYLLSQGVGLMGGLVSQALSKHIIPVTGGLPPGVNLRDRAGE
ncbi:MAG: hypothetical protein QME78_10105 [Thermodesulfobacteriota bacterium]|nr:hypothetical protein [Thermodesulfobacteriota bacterium]